MQTRPYPQKDGVRVWLSRGDQRRLLNHYRDEYPDRQLAIMLGLHGLRSEEIVGDEDQPGVSREDFRQLDGDQEYYALRIGDNAKRDHHRELPVSSSVRQQAVMISNINSLRQGQRIIDVTTRTLREWIGMATDAIAEETDDERWHRVGMHDLRRTWATDTFYSLAAGGNPIAEELTMSWGGWVMTESGRQTFRQNYLGPIPDHVTVQALQTVQLPE